MNRMTSVKTKSFRIKKQFSGFPKEENFELIEKTHPPLSDDGNLKINIFFQFDACILSSLLNCWFLLYLHPDFICFGEILFRHPLAILVKNTRNQTFLDIVYKLVHVLSFLDHFYAIKKFLHYIAILEYFTF